MRTELLAASTFGHHVAHVVGSSSNPQMWGPYACSDIAGVADIQVFRNWAVQSDVDVAMNSPHNMVDVDLSVTTRPERSGPEQTLIALNCSGEDSDKRVCPLRSSFNDPSWDWASSSPALIMSGAPTACIKLFVTIYDGTYAGHSAQHTSTTKVCQL